MQMKHRINKGILRQQSIKNLKEFFIQDADTSKIASNQFFFH